MRFYERREVRDAVAYLKVVANPDDVVSLRRVLNTPNRGIGERAESAVERFADRERIPFASALRRTSEIGELATRCRQGGVTCHAIVGQNDLDAFSARILDLASLTEATTLDELEQAGRRLVA